MSGIQYSFINPPIVELKFSGLASVAEFLVLDHAVKEALQSSLASRVVLPNRSLYKMSVNNNFLDTYQPSIGVARLTIQSGRGFVNEKRLLGKDDIPDVYLNITYGGKKGATWRTTTVHDDCNPQFNEMEDVLLLDRGQMVCVHAWDEDQLPLDPDDDLGSATVSIGELLLAPQQTIEFPLALYHKNTGCEKDTSAFVTLSCDICHWTTDLKSLEKEESSTVSPSISHNSIVGLLVIIVKESIGKAANEQQDKKQ
jgi:Ca2+-dependent lipid-binding protein